MLSSRACTFSLELALEEIRDPLLPGERFGLAVDGRRQSMNDFAALLIIFLAISVIAVISLLLLAGSLTT